MSSAYDHQPQRSFHDDLHDWLARTPWLAISVAFHLVAFLVIQAIPWALFEAVPETIIIAQIEVAEELALDPEPEPEPEEIEVPEEELPVIQEHSLNESSDAMQEDSFDEPHGEPGQLSNAPLDADLLNSVIGIGGGAGGKYGTRFGAGKGTITGRRGTEQSLADGLQWLARHQGRDGSWDADGYGHGVEDSSCDCSGAGLTNQDIGVTALALLAFLGDGHTSREGDFQDVVQGGLRWLLGQQDYESGLIGEDIGHSFIYDHAVATLALCEAYHFSKSPTLKRHAKRALRYIESARDPYGAWRYAVPSLGDADTSITGWMVLALRSAQEAGLRVDQGALDGALAWLDEATDPGTGRTGYDSRGSVSSRLTGVNDHFPTDGAEAMTSVSLLSRFFLGQLPQEEPLMEQQADLLLRSLPEWDPAGLGCDMYAWYYGTYAMFQMGGRHWQAWNKAMKGAVVDSQDREGCAKGSWEPVGPWGFSGGRVYSTALMVLCLEVYFRYGRGLGAR